MKESQLSPNQLAFLRNVSGSSQNNYSDADYGADYESDYENDFDEPSFTAPPPAYAPAPAPTASNRTPPKHPHRSSPPPKPFPAAAAALRTSLSRELSVSSAVGSEIQEDIPEELQEDHRIPKKSLSPPLIADSPQIKNPKSKQGSSSSLPPPPPPNGNTNSANNPPVNPVLNHRSPSVEDTYSSDEDHVDLENYKHTPEKGKRSDLGAFSTTGSDNVEHGTMNMEHSVNGSSGGSVGKQLVQEALSRPHPRGATVSRRERVRKGRWKQGNKIGNGSFGTVFMGMNQSSGTLMAIKSMPLFNADAKDVQDLQTEIDIMRKLSHPNIVRYFGAELNEEDGVLNIFQEWVPGGSISTLLVKMGAFSIPVVRSYLKQVLLGLEYLHGHRIIHRDIKGGNILVDNYGTVKLADFGASKKMNEEGTLNGMGMSMKGTPYFMAPEVLSHEKYGRKADMWSTGGVALQMATGEPPWKSLGLRTPVSLFFHIQTSEDPPPLSDKIEANPKLKNIILQCFARDPSERPRATELLKDPFFNEEDDDDDDSETTFSDANDEYHYYEGESDDDSRNASLDDNNGANAQQLPPSPTDKGKTPKMSTHKSKSRGFEGGYKEVGRFDIKTAKKRAELRSGKGGPNSPQIYADLGINDLLPESADGYREIKPAKKQPRPATTVVQMQQKKQPATQRPQTTLKTKQLERQESEYHSTEEIPSEWPSWARQKSSPTPPPNNSPASNYGTPKEEGTNNDVNPFARKQPAPSAYGTPKEDGTNADVNPFARKQPTAAGNVNPFARKQPAADANPGRQTTLLPKPSSDSPTSLMKGPTIEQYQLDNSPKTIKENRVRAKTATTVREAYSSGGSSNPDSPNALTAVTRSHASGEKIAAAKAAADEDGKWTCSKCGYVNASSGLQYCENCASWRRVEGGKGDGREVVTVSGAWSSMQKSSDMDKGNGNGNGGFQNKSERHQAGRMRRAKSGDASMRSSRELQRNNNGTKSAAAGRNFRKKWGGQG